VYGLISRDCKGMGICKINVVKLENHQPSTSGCGSSLAYLTLEKAVLSLDFLRETISKEQFALRFAEGNFYLEEPFFLPSELAALLGLSKACLAEGKHPIRYSEDYISIEFSQQELGLSNKSKM
jgi:hypothetical protein